MSKDVKVGILVGVAIIAAVCVYFFTRPKSPETGPLTKETPAATEPVIEVGEEVVVEENVPPPAEEPPPAEVPIDVDTPPGEPAAAQPRPAPTPADLDRQLGPTPGEAGPAAVAPPPLPEPKTEKTKTYVVKKGDTLSDIAEKFYGKQKKWRLIAKANPKVDPNNLRVGEKLTIPAATAKTQPAAPTPSDKRIYQVKKGDTLYSIAKQVYGKGEKFRLILSANADLLKGDPKNLRPGMKLKIPKE